MDLGFINVLRRVPGENETIAVVNLDSPGGRDILVETIRHELQEGRTLLIEKTQG